MAEYADELEYWATRELEWHWHRCPICRSRWECEGLSCEDDVRQTCPPCIEERHEAAALENDREPSAPPAESA